MVTGFDFIAGGAWWGMGESKDDDFPKYFGFCVGLGYMLGYDLSPVEDLHIIIGSSLGLYFEFWRNIIKQWDWSDSEGDGIWMKTDETSTYSFNILAPIIKVQYSYFEIAYRGLVGYYRSNPNMDSIPEEYQKTVGGFDWMRHQLTIGCNFGRSR